MCAPRRIREVQRFPTTTTNEEIKNEGYARYQFSNTLGEGGDEKRQILRSKFSEGGGR